MAAGPCGYHDYTERKEIDTKTKKSINSVRSLGANAQKIFDIFRKMGRM